MGGSALPLQQVERAEVVMADPKELEEVADAILRVRRLSAVQRHQELDTPLRLAEEWARKQYRKVSEQSDGENPCGLNGRPLPTDL